MATLPNPRTWVVGELLTAAKLNTDVRDGLNFLLRPPLFHAKQFGSQSIPNATFTDITFGVGSEEIDSDGGHVDSPNPERYVVQTAGWYHVEGIVGYQFNATGSRYAVLRTFGVDKFQVAVRPPADTETYVPIHGYFPCAVNDQLTISAYQTSGGALSTSQLRSSFSVQWEYKT
ncbi:hypothetical protein [Nonomuraea sp. CA-141351]|uniref:hypothetical protein n=1 Tax=Nonomuraea sp. CA-141351 TaxID=3239996 RepID=UPI003D90CC64